MCTVSMIADFYREKWDKPQSPMYPWINYPNTNPGPGIIPNWPVDKGLGPQGYGLPITGPSQKDFDDLKKEVMDLKELLLRAKKYDEDNNEPDCEMDEKVALIKKIGQVFGVDMEKVFK